MQLYHQQAQPAVKGWLVTRLLKRGLAFALAAALVALIVYVSVLPAVQKQAGGKRGKGLGGGPVPVLAAQANIADVPVYLEGVGTARARNTVTVRPQVDGRILSINFQEGQEVKKGDVLAMIDPATYQAQLDQAIAKKALDEVQLANAERDLDRYTKLGGNIVAQKTIDTQRALAAQLAAQIKQDDAAIANAKAFLDYTTIVAPIDGRTGIRMVDAGNLVRAADVGIVVITEVRPISVLFTLPQQQLIAINKALALGPVSAYALDADGKTALDRGILQVVDNQVDPTTGTVRMKAEFPNATMQLWPGQFVNVRVLIDTLKQVVVIPTPAVQRGPTGTFAYVLQDEDRVVYRPVAIAHQTETQAVIGKGIAASERVVTTGFGRLKDGSRVVVATPEEEEKRAAPPAPVAAKDGKGGVRTACAEDAQKLCANVEQSRNAIRACLQEHAAQLSEACKAAVAESSRKRDARKAEGGSSQ
jgi:membrane fusion protein, multidrug efflux system